MQFNDDEIETIKEIIREWGSDCPDTDYEKVKELEYKLGISVRPTAEEIAEQERRRKEWAESPFGKEMSKILNASNYLLNDIYKDVDILFGETNFKIGSTLRIRLPNAYTVKENKNE